MQNQENVLQALTGCESAPGALRGAEGVGPGREWSGSGGRSQGCRSAAGVVSNISGWEQIKLPELVT